MMKPLVSVILPVYNTSKYLKETIQSLLNQTYSNIEIIAIDDASTDNSLSILRTFNDSRLMIYENEKNLGLIQTLNKAMNLAKGEFYARMDSDDICHPQRLEKQVSYFEKHPDCILLGTDRTTINEKGQNLHYYTRPATGSAIMTWKILTGNFITHPSVMMRANKIPKNLYEDKYQHSEDYAAWLRLSALGEIDVLPEKLLSYRVHSASMIQTNKSKHVIAASGALLDHLTKYYNQSFSQDAVSLWISPQESIHLPCPSDYLKLLFWMNPLHSKFRRNLSFFSTVKCMVHYYRRLFLLCYLYRNRPNLLIKILCALVISLFLVN